MENKVEIFGCFLAVGYDPERKASDSRELSNVASSYLWGDMGIDNKLKQLRHEDYGSDLKLALFEFYAKPSPFEKIGLKEIQSYRKKEKSIGITIVIDDENFFSKTELERIDFLKQTILQRLDPLAEVVKKKKLDTDMVRLKADLARLFAE